MKDLPSYSALVESFRKLPGIGTKSAQRMASAVLELSDEDALAFSDAIENAKKRIHKCPNCGLFTEDELCSVCVDETRDHSICVVVAQPKDAEAFESIPGFNGIYHVLGGLISPSRGIGPEELAIDSLKERIEKEGIKEALIAVSPTLEGETTVMFLAKLFESIDVKVSRLGYGLPMGSSLEYADALTLSKAMEGRKFV